MEKNASKTQKAGFVVGTVAVALAIAGIAVFVGVAYYRHFKQLNSATSRGK